MLSNPLLRQIFFRVGTRFFWRERVESSRLPELSSSERRLEPEGVARDNGLG